MKKLIFLLLITPLSIWGQNSDVFISKREFFNVFNLNNKFYLPSPVICKTDSIRWVVISIIAKGDSLCEHSFVVSEDYIPNGYYGCLAMHGNGCHCDANDPHRKSICEKCGYHVEQRETVFQSVVKKEKSAYEKTVDLFKH